MKEETGTLSIMDASGEKNVYWQKFKSYFANQSEKDKKKMLEELIQEVPAGAKGETTTALAPFQAEPEDVAAARKLFDDKMKSGKYEAYGIDAKGKHKMTDFDPDAAHIIMTPKLYGGKY